MNLTSVTSLTGHSLDITAATSTTAASVLDNQFGKSHRRDLPIFNVRDLIIQTINDSPVTLISGMTGSGKSTQVAQYIYDYQKANKKQCKIAICQPRKIAAITIAQRVAADRGVLMGSEVGYQIALKREHSTDPDCPTGLLFCTTGVLLQQLIFAKSMSRYTHIFLDEVHEREVDTDFLLILMKTMLADTPNVKIVLLSATMDTDRFRDYFMVTLDDGTFLPPVVDLAAEQQPHPVSEYYIEDILRVWPDVDSGSGQLIDYNEPGINDNLYDMTASLILICLRHHAETDESYLHKPPSILVFLPGLQEIESLHSRLVKAETLKQFEKLKMTPEICVLHSTLSTEEQKVAFLSSGNPKIILSTNIAESGESGSDARLTVFSNSSFRRHHPERVSCDRLLSHKIPENGQRLPNLSADRQLGVEEQLQTAIWTCRPRLQGIGVPFGRESFLRQANAGLPAAGNAASRT